MSHTGSTEKTLTTKSSPISPRTRASIKDTTSIKSSPGSLSGLELLASAKGEASVSATGSNSDCATILNSSSASLNQLGSRNNNAQNNSASQSLESIMRKSSNSSLSGQKDSPMSKNVSPGTGSATITVDAQHGIEDQSAVATSSVSMDIDLDRDNDNNSTMSSDAAVTAPSPTAAVVGSREGHSVPTDLPSSGAEPYNTQSESHMDVDPSLSPKPVSDKTERIVRTNSDNNISSSAVERHSSLSVLATWWSGSSSTTPASSNRSTPISHDHTTNTHQSPLALTTISISGESISCADAPINTLTSAPESTSIFASSLSSTTIKDKRFGSVGWEPTGPEAAYVQRTKQPSQSASLPSSLPSTAAFPTSMLKHSKLADTSSGRRGSASSAQGSLSVLLWNKLATSQDNLLCAESATNSSKTVVKPETGSTPASTLMSTSSSTAGSVMDMDMDMDSNTKGGLSITPLNAKVPDSQSSLGRKRWSIFGYGSKDDNKDEPVTKRPLQRSGDVLIEPESRPSSISEPNRRPETPTPPSPLNSDSPVPVKTVLVESSNDGGVTAPAVIGTSELSVVVPPGTAFSKSKAESNANTYGTMSSSYSWLSMIGYGVKADDASSTKGVPSSHQVTDYEEGERKDVNGNIVELEAQPRGRTFAQLAEARSSKEILSSKESVTDSPMEGHTFAQLKERETMEEGKAIASLSKVIFKKKNVVLPNYYEQFSDDVRQSLLTIPIGPTEVSTDSPKHERSGSIVKSAVSALSSLLFSKSPTVEATPTMGDEALHRGASGIRKVAIIGVHGWFPIKLIRTVIGEPTGTSKKFCDEMDLALKDYLKIHNVELDPEDITLIPLEGEGKVLKRVEILYQNLVKNDTWKNAIHEADLVLVATHSQGTPTSTMLIARLIEEGMLRVDENDPKMQRIGILAMAGISHGPFPFLKGNLIVRWFEADAAQELFEFMDSDTDIAKTYREALRTVLTSGVRFTCVASLEDQVVPLYSAVMTSIHHPSIVRAVYIDGASFQDDFLTNLISFSMRLRNSGIDDHGVLVHLSEVVAGSIYGEGHSTIYEEREVYLLAIRSLLEPPNSLTSEMARSEPILHPFQAKQTLNPFYLPWGMRGVMDEIKSRGDKTLDGEMERLKKLYDDWKPVSKGMKEIKFRLEPLRSKL